MFIPFVIVAVFFSLDANAAPGNFDTSFSSDGRSVEMLAGGNNASQVEEIAIQSDGKIVAAGSIWVGSTEGCGIVRYDTDGSIDFSFGGGVVFISSVRCYATAIQSEGKIVVAGYLIQTARFTLLRLNPDGSFDTTFDGDGVVNTSIEGGIRSLGIQSDGKILAGGYGSGKFALARFSADGSLDTSFDGDGIVHTDFSSTSAYLRDVTIQPDGKIIAVGKSEGDIAIARYNTDGSLDLFFDGDGKVVTILGRSQEAVSVTLQSDGKIVAACYLSIQSAAFSDFAVVRYNPDGSLDTSFDGDGFVTTDFFESDRPGSVAIQKDGSIVVVGHTGIHPQTRNDFAIARYLPNGALDTSFDGDGKLTTPIRGTDLVVSVVIQTDGRIVSAGTSGIGLGPDFALVRYETNGSLDASFGSGGIVTSDLGGGVSTAQAVAVQSDGKIVAVGTVGSTSQADFVIIRYNANGSHDPSFSDDGLVKTDIQGSGDNAFAVAVQADGKIVVAGRGSNGVTDFFALARYNTDGSLDPSFDGDGKLATGVGGISLAYALAIQPDGKIVAGGITSNGTNFDFALVRYNTNGSLDTSFNGSGIVTTAFAGSDDEAYALAIQPDGKIVAVGSTYVGSTGSGYDFAAARYNANGTLDSSFDGDGRVTTSMFTTREGANGVAVQQDGKIIVAGLTNINGTTVDDFGLVRYNTNGSLDFSFDGDGKLTTDVSGSDFANAIAIQSDGKILAAGGSAGDFSIVRYHANGTLDSSYGVGGKAILDLFSGRSDRIYGMAIDSNERAVVVGDSGGLFAAARILGDAAVQSAPFDFDGDGKTDVGIYRPAGGEWWWRRSSDLQVPAVQFGLGTDVIAPGDFTGDGKMDIAFFRPSDGFWNVLRSEDFSYFALPFGTSGDVPVTGDYDGDGKADVAVFRPSGSTWFILRSSDGGTTITGFGAAGDVPVTADYDGDGKDDIGIYRPSVGEWWISRSTAGLLALQFGSATDKTVPGDYTGDGKADIAVWRPSTGEWYIVRSEDLSFFAFPFGQNGDIPAPGDYDGDGKMDAAIFRNGVWYIAGSTSGTQIIGFGVTGDRPIPNSFVR